MVREKETITPRREESVATFPSPPGEIKANLGKVRLRKEKKGRWDLLRRAKKEGGGRGFPTWKAKSFLRICVRTQNSGMLRSINAPFSIQRKRTEAVKLTKKKKNDLEKKNPEYSLVKIHKSPKPKKSKNQGDGSPPKNNRTHFAKIEKKSPRQRESRELGKRKNMSRGKDKRRKGSSLFRNVVKSVRILYKACARQSEEKKRGGRLTGCTIS